MANPAAFDRAMIRATTILFGPQEDGRASHRSGDGGRQSPSTHEADQCSAIVDAFQQASPPSGDVNGIAHAIEVVEANCEKNPQASGLLNALQRLIANAQKHAERESHAGGRWNGVHGDRSDGGGQGHDAGATGPDVDDPGGAGQGDGGAHGHGAGNGNGGGNGTGGGSSHGH
jgi:hypothetical protein